MGYKIKVDKEKCISCGACINQCNNLELGDDGKAQPKQAEVKEIGCNKEAEKVCPVEAIKITKIK